LGVRVNTGGRRFERCDSEAKAIAALAEHSADIHGRVLEIADDRYTQRFGSNVSQSDNLDVEQNQLAGDNSR
jgi:hypothetical protein